MMQTRHSGGLAPSVAAKPPSLPSPDYTNIFHLTHNIRMAVSDALELAGLIKSEIITLPKDDPIHACGPAPLHILQLRPDDVLSLAHQKLHTWKYSDVSLCWRRLYEEASLWKAINLITSHGLRGQKRKRNDLPPKEDWITDLVNILDMAMILTGAPSRRDLILTIFSVLQDFQDPNENTSIPSTFPTSTPSPQPSTFPREPTLSFLEFQNHLNTTTTPLIISGAIETWPAMSSWNNPNYLLNKTLNGRRLVPIELGRTYTDSNWSQKIMTFRDYIKTYLLSPTPTIGYLAQHDLFTQIPTLSNDIVVPDYCYTTPPDTGAGVQQLDEPLKNAWLGPQGTVSPLHTDPYHNVLCQVVGWKFVRLYAPKETPKLYPRGVDGVGVDMGNTSGVDVDLARRLWSIKDGNIGDEKETVAEAEIEEQRRRFEKEFPSFREAEFVEGVLAPGEMLYIPQGWWHYIESLSTSFSVSFWWN